MVLVSFGDALEQFSKGTPAEPLLEGFGDLRNHLAHALFDLRRWEASRGVLLRYLEDVKAAGPQKILNMPDGFLGKKVSDAERKASRFREATQDYRCAKYVSSKQFKL